MRIGTARLASINAATDSMRAELVAHRLKRVMVRLQTALERHYNPNWASQPRVPAGHPDGGRWTDGGRLGDGDASTGSGATSESGPETMVDFLDQPLVPGQEYAQARQTGQPMRRVGRRMRTVTYGQAVRYDEANWAYHAALRRVREIDPHWRPRPQMTSTIEGEIAGLRAQAREAEARWAALNRPFNHPDGRPDLTPPPRGWQLSKVPRKRPARMRDENRIVHRFAQLAEAAGHLIDAFEATEPGSWFHEHMPRLESYLDPPRSLTDLQRMVDDPEVGYDIHHIVEQGPARASEFPEALINGRENLIRIPTYKHWQITGWYAKPNERFNMLSLRDFLRDKSWEERREIGMYALRLFKVLEK